MEIIKKIDDISEKEYDTIKNILLLTLSTINSSEKRPLSWNSNDWQNEEAYVGGYSQLEPVPNMLIKRDYKPLLIIVMATEEIRTEEPKDIYYYKGKNTLCKVRGTSLDFFKWQVCENCGEDNVNFKVVDAGTPENAVQASAETIRKIKKDEEKKLNLFLDIHGGPRENQMVVDALVSMLRMEGIKIKDAFSIAKAGAPIKSVRKELDIFDFVSGMNEFINYGYAKSFRKYADKDPSLRKITDQMGNISDSLALCKVKAFEEALDKLGETLNPGSGGDSDADQGGQGAEQGKLIQIFSGTFANDFKNLLKKESRSIFDEVQWAKKKGFYQQCLAIVEAKTPEFVFNTIFDMGYRTVGQRVGERIREEVRLDYNGVKLEKKPEEEGNWSEIENENKTNEIESEKKEREKDAAAFLLRWMFERSGYNGRAARWDPNPQLLHGDRNYRFQMEFWGFGFEPKHYRLTLPLKKTSVVADDFAKNFVEFGEVWTQLKSYRNDIFHVNEENIPSKKALDKELNSYITLGRKLEEQVRVNGTTD